MEPKKALITGITGQDGSYLAEFLLSKGYEVYGMVRRSSTLSNERIAHIQHKIKLIEGDLGDTASLVRIMQKVRPHEVYNLAAMSFVKASWDEPVATGNITGLGVTRILEAIKIVDPRIKFYQASSSEMFGKACEVPQNEKTPFHPRSPYGISKCYGHYVTVNYRESYGMFACSGILFNHESTRRGFEFVTRKISNGVAKIKLGMAKEIRLGNLNAKRDWGYAGDYVKAMWLMLQQPEPGDYVIGTGETHSVAEFAEEAFKVVGIKNWRKYVVEDETFKRPADVELLIADIKKAREKLGWQPSINFKQLVRMMVLADLQRLKKIKKMKAAHEVPYVGTSHH